MSESRLLYYLLILSCIDLYYLYIYRRLRSGEWAASLSCDVASSRQGYVATVVGDSLININYWTETLMSGCHLPVRQTRSPFQGRASRAIFRDLIAMRKTVS